MELHPASAHIPYVMCIICANFSLLNESTRWHADDLSQRKLSHLTCTLIHTPICKFIAVAINLQSTKLQSFSWQKLWAQNWMIPFFLLQFVLFIFPVSFWNKDLCKSLTVYLQEFKFRFLRCNWQCELY